MREIYYCSKLTKRQAEILEIQKLSNFIYKFGNFIGFFASLRRCIINRHKISIRIAFFKTTLEKFTWAEYISS